MRVRPTVAVVLAIIALVIVYLFATARGHLALLAAALTLAVLMIVGRRAAKRARAFHADNKAALAALAHGDLTDAQTTWARWAFVKGAPRMAALAGHNLAWTMLRRGELTEAIATLEDNEARNLAALEAIGLAATSAADRALAHGLLGEDSKAESWLEHADKRLPKATIPTAGAIALARSVVHCRAGRVDVATKLLDEGWADIEATTTGDVLRPLRVVRAFAHAAAGPRAAGVAEVGLSSVRPTYPDEYKFLGVKWPEMAAFLAAHELAG
jgi:tetratricopeptide (TPR) repeat protein